MKTETRKATRTIDKGERTEKTFVREFQSPLATASDLSQEFLTEARRLLGRGANDADVVNAVNNGLFLWLNPRVAEDMVRGRVAPSDAAIGKMLSAAIEQAVVEQSFAKAGEIAAAKSKAGTRAELVALWERWFKVEESVV